MTDALSRVRELLTHSDSTLVISREGEIVTDTQRGIMPLVRLIDSGIDYHGAYAADRIVGKAAAMLYILLGVSGVYAEVLSKEGRELLEQHHIRAEYGTLTDRIVNRMGTGPCPMDAAVRDIGSPEEALTAIRNKLRQLNHN